MLLTAVGLGPLGTTVRMVGLMVGLIVGVTIVVFFRFCCLIGSSSLLPCIGLITSPVGLMVGSIVGLMVGASVGANVGLIVGVTVGSSVGANVGLIVGVSVGSIVGLMVGASVGANVGLAEAYSPDAAFQKMQIAFAQAVAAKDSKAMLALVGPTFLWMSHSDLNDQFDFRA
jgi:hypothetical protein